MILLFDEDELKFENLGLGVLRDATSCTVKEELNGEYSLSMQYPISGSNFEKLVENRIIYVKPNPYDDYQPFRIYSISRPIGGTVTVTAYHISYDLNGVICQPFKGGSLLDTITKIQNNIDDTRFKFVNGHAIDDKYYRTYQITTPTNVKAILSSDDEAVCGEDGYDCELKYDKWVVRILGHRGSDRGEEIRYAKNMTDLTQEITTENLCSAVYPYYHKESTSSDSSSTEDGFTKVYIVGKKPYQDGWFSFEENGEPYHPTSDNPVQVQTEGDFKDKIYAWDTNTQRYIEKKYNETVTLISGVVEPTWIKIDWSGFPTVKAVAQVDGYFKALTETEYTKYSAGDTVYEGKITDISGITGNMMLYFAEVIPPTSSSTTEEVSNITHVELDEKYLTTDDMTDAKKMKFKYVKLLDLTSEFDEEPSQEKLREKAKEYVKENKIGKLKKTTDVSFINLNATTNAENFKILSHVELGDTVRVLYTNLGVDEKLRVITTEYNVLTNQYESVELGEKKETLSDNSVQTGDNVSSLSNNAGYTNSSEVSKIIANTITADYIQAINAKLTKAQIEQLSVARINCTGIFEASQFVLDELVASKLTADNAKIAQTLEAGTIKVSGDITVLSGQISITGDDGTVFNVDRDGKVTANDMNITGGSITIENDEGSTTFEVTKEGYLTASGAKVTGDIIALAGQIGDCVIDEQGKLTVPAANITGTFEVGQISNFDSSVTTITNDTLSTTNVLAENLHVNAANINGSLTIGQISDDAQTTISNNASDLTEEKLRNAKLGNNSTISGYIIDKDGLRTFAGRDVDGNPTDEFDSLTTDKKNGVYLSDKGIRLGELPSTDPSDYYPDNYCANTSIEPGAYVGIITPSGKSFEKSKKYCVVFDVDYDNDKYEYPDVKLGVYTPDSNGNMVSLGTANWSDPNETYGSLKQSHKDVYFEFETLADSEPDLSFYYEYSKSIISNIRIYRVTPKGFIVNSDGTLIATEGYIGGATIHGGVLRVPSAQISGKITADVVESNEGHIANFTINERGLHSPDSFDSMDKSLTGFTNGDIANGGIYVGTDGIRLGEYTITYEATKPIIKVSSTGYLYYLEHSNTHVCTIDVNGENIYANASSDDGFVIAYISANTGKVVSGYPIVTSSYDALYNALNSAPIETFLVLTSTLKSALSITSELRTILADSFGGDETSTYTDSNGAFVFIGYHGSSSPSAFEYVGDDTDSTIETFELRCSTDKIVETSVFSHEFKVTKDGKLYSDYGKIGGFVIDKTRLYLEPSDGFEPKVSFGEEGLVFRDSVGADFKGFKIDTDGTIYSNSGYIGGFTIANNSLYSPITFSSLDAADTFKVSDNVSYPTTQGVYISPEGFRIGVNAKEFFDDVYNNKKMALSIWDTPQISNIIFTSSGPTLMFDYFKNVNNGEYYTSVNNSYNSYSYYRLYFETTKANLDIYITVKNLTVYPSEDYGVISKLNKDLSYGRKIADALTDDEDSVAKSYKGIKTTSSDETVRDNVLIGRTGDPGTYYITVKYIKQSSYEESHGDYFRIYDIYALESFESVKWIDPESEIRHGGIYSDKYGQVTIVNGQFHGLFKGLTGSIVDTYKFSDGCIYYNDELIINNGKVLADYVNNYVKLKYDSTNHSVYSEIDNTSAVIPYATSTSVGLIKSGKTASLTQKYAVDIDGDGAATVTVPWENTLVSSVEFENDEDGSLNFLLYYTNYSQGTFSTAQSMTANVPAATTTSKGVVQLGDATGTSTDKAATVNLATTLYNKLNKAKVNGVDVKEISTLKSANTKTAYTAIVPTSDGVMRYVGQSIVFASSTEDESLETLIPGGIAIIDE